MSDNLTLPLSTAQVARKLQRTYAQLWGAIQRGHLNPPAKNASGSYVWLPADVERARQFFADRKRQAVRHGR